MLKRKSDVFLFYILANIFILAILLGHAFFERKRSQPFLMQRISMILHYQLTDLCLFTDARYTRHPSMADMNTAFQDHPFSFEHFPSGSLVAPPVHIRNNHGLD